MQRFDAVKVHKSRGAYEDLVALGRGYYQKGQAESEEAGVRLAVHKHPDIAQRFSDGPQYPQWRYLDVIKSAMGVGQQEAFTEACINTALRLNKSFARQVARGDFMVSAATLVEKAEQERNRPDPLPRGMTATEALIHVAKRYIAEGLEHREAYDLAAREHPSWCEKQVQESLGR